MARTVRNPKLNTRSARTKLKARREPYWTPIAPGCTLGYRKGAKGGTWIAKYRGSDGGRQYFAIGPADDAMDANGATALNFGQAQERARDWFSQTARKSDGDEPEKPSTVADAMKDYMAWLTVHRRSANATQYSVDAFILPAFGDTDISNLTTKAIRDWHEELAAAPARLRTAPGHAQQYRDSGGPEATRKRRSTANRVLTMLKAGLNHAYREGNAPSDDAWRRVDRFEMVDGARIRYLSKTEIPRLVNACPLDFRRLVQAALLTGARYGELTALKVHDFIPDSGTVLIRASKSGRARHVVLTDEAQTFFQQVATGRDGEVHLFLRDDGQPWGRAHQNRRLAEACTAASITPAISFHILRHTHASHLAMQDAPMIVIARQLGHRDTRMVEKHYAHLSPSYIADTIRASFPTLGIVEETNVAALQPRKA